MYDLNVKKYLAFYGNTVKSDDTKLHDYEDLLNINSFQTNLFSCGCVRNVINWISGCMYI